MGLKRHFCAYSTRLKEIAGAFPVVAVPVIWVPCQIERGGVCEASGFGVHGPHELVSQQRDHGVPEAREAVRR